jgi:AcrR family transcriptional regulator
MAKVNLQRRAEIGREKSARTRAQIIAAAHSLFARQAVESITVDDVVQEADVAKGTFYVHFQDLSALTAAAADELVRTLDELLQPARLSIEDPVLRIAFACNAFIEKVLEEPSWGIVVARMARSVASVGKVARQRLLEDLRRAAKEMRQGAIAISPRLGQEIVFGVIAQLLSAFGEGRLSSSDREEAIRAILRAIGVSGQRIKSTLARLARELVRPIDGEPLEVGRGATAR